MSLALSKPTHQSMKLIVPWVALTVCLIALAASLLLHDMLFHGESFSGAGSATKGAATATPSSTAEPKTVNSVTLSEGKLKVADIQTAAAAVVLLSSEVGVPGKIDANPDRQMAIRPRSSGIVRQVNATLGQKVKKGDILAILDSPDIGTARLNLRGRQIELATARIELDWKRQIATNVNKLIPELSKGVTAATIQKQYADRPLGSYRGLLIQAYTEVEIASHEAEKTGNLHRERIVGEHPKFLTQHTQEAAQAKFESVLEQVRFDSRHEQVLSEQKVQLAEAAVIDAAQRLRILGVPEEIKQVLEHAGNVAATSTTGDDVIAYKVVAPFDGTIISKAIVPSQKAEINDVLFTLADLSTVWVMANVPESDFGVLPALKSGSFRLTAAAYPGQTFDAKLLSVGASVDPATRSVPMMAEVKNPDDVLKLGMFVRITLDTPTTQEALVVPSSAIVEIDGKMGVFLPTDPAKHTYTFHEVKPGRTSGEHCVINTGLSKGDRVVSRGAFTLKSELILQSETEEE